MLVAADGGQMSGLCLLDLTAAFDIVDHILLLDRLQRQFALRDNVLVRFRSYLSERTFQVVYGGNAWRTVAIFVSSHKDRCLVRGCLLNFILYTADLPDKIDEHGINFHAYADDSQLYVLCDCCDTAPAAPLFEHCIIDVGDWMSANQLKLNADKTKLLWTGTKHSLSLRDGCGPNLCLGKDTITPSKHVRVLGVTISSDLGLDKHVSNVCAAKFF